MTRLTRRAWMLALVATSAVSGASEARADLAADVARVQQTWAASGTVRVLPPRVLTQGAQLPLALERLETSPRTDACTSIALLAAPSISYIVRFVQDDSADEPAERPEVSVGGLVQLARCGRRRAVLNDAVVEMRSPRGILQTVVARGDAPFEAAQRFLLHRDAGTAGTATTPGPRPSGAPVTERAALLQERLRRAGALDVQRRLVPASPAGLAFVTFDLPPGCHSLHALGISSTSGPGPGLDVDLEITWTRDGSVIASDRSDSPDALATFCTGETDEALITVAGGGAGMPLLLVYATWPLPEELPERWGGLPRAAVAEAMRESHLGALPSRPVLEVLGVAGSTLLPVELEPDACYVAAVAPLRGEPQDLSASVVAGSVQRRATASSPRSAALLGFCARGSDRGELNVEAHGPSLAWIAALWQTGRIDLGAP